MNFSLKIFLIYLAVINLYSLYIMYKDKEHARKKMWRTPEATLFLLAAALGSIGILSGMYVFHHKTKHIKFTIGIPCILALQIYAFVKLLQFIN